MHPFLRAIGFSEAFSSEYELGLLLDNIASTYDRRMSFKESDGVRTFVEMSKTFGPNMGLKVCGELDGNGFSRLFYFPYLSGKTISSKEYLNIDRRTDGYSYSAMLDDGHVGVSLIFYVQNPAQVMKSGLLQDYNRMGITTALTGLSSSGTILLPVYHGKKQEREEQEIYYQKHDNLVMAAKNGNQDAIEALTYEDMDLYAMLSRRVMHEDVYSIVDSYFIPYGMECDLYNVMGEITNVNYASNTVTGEKIVRLSIITNEIPMEICINEKDLLGEPEIGRRFKGVIWLQGHLCLNGEDIQSAGI